MAAESITYEILLAAAQQEALPPFLTQALPAVLSGCRGDFAALATASGGAWVVVGSAGASATTLPAGLLAEALDAERVIARDEWIVAPLDCRATSPDALLVRAAPAARGTVEAFLPALRQAVDSVRERQRQASRLARLQAILEIAGQWNKAESMETLLTQMAQVATRLLDADRASIFLWDKPARQLVGRPALGVAGDELRVADDIGIVGQVLKTDAPRRLGRADDRREVNRRVDTALDYKTETLLCVPLRGKRGDLFGAFEAINKRHGEFTADDEAALVELAAHASIALENTQEREHLLESRKQLVDQAAEGVQLIGESPAIAALRSTVLRVAGAELAVLVLGENGTGKEVVSQSIHYNSPRRNHPFIAVNCAALSETLLESELFGHEKGAFTDAHQTHRGKFELADGGTLFLDEIGDLSLAGQAKLLRVLEEKVVVRVGGSQQIHTDARVIAATNQDLAVMVREKRFRQDLFFRLNVVTLSIPALRDRREDILPLAEHFLKDFSRKARRKAPKFTAEARRRLEQHPWPGNVRELRNLMERLAYLVPAEKIEADDLAFILTADGKPPSVVPPELELSEATDRFQAEHISQAIRRAHGNMSDAAERLGLHRSNLYRKMRQLDMNVEG